MGVSAPLKACFKRVKQFAALGLGARDGGVVECDVLIAIRSEQLFADHPVHQGANGRICPRRFGKEFFLNGRGGAGFGFPDGFDDGPLGFGQFNRLFGHGDNLG
jgi:hypothetical protein